MEREYIEHDEMRFLQKRGATWHYKRRVPRRYLPFDAREFARGSLKTTSLETAKARRNAREKADDIYWAQLAGIDDGSDQEARQRKMAQKRYDAACLRALGHGFTYVPAAELAENASLGEIVTRVETLDHAASGNNARILNEAEALLGGAPKPPVLVSEAYEIYCREIAADELVGKSEAQKALWLKTKKRGIQYFIDLTGDVPITSITRQQAQAYYKGLT